MDIRTIVAAILFVVGGLSLAFMPADNSCPKCGHPLDQHQIVNGSYWCDSHLWEVGQKIPGK
jgi:hypothetical protein